MAFIAILVITPLYLFVAITMGEVPGARGFFGHTLGILGFVLMLMTELLYSFRKRSRRARGKMATWLRFHIFTGIVGPYLVLLHSSWKFNGLAGIVLLLTVIVVISGFIGRYIYTAVPRTAGGAVIEAGELEQAIARAEQNLTARLAGRSEIQYTLQPLLSREAASTGFLGPIFGRTLNEWRSRFLWWQVRNSLHGLPRQELAQIEELLARRRTLQRQIAAIAAARRVLALWHTIHVPIGLALFFTAFVHIVGAIYYASLLR